MDFINTYEKLNKKVLEILRYCINISEQSGIRIYLVGGIVRDIILEKPLKDIDITVEGNAHEFVNILSKGIKTKNIKYNKNLPTAKVTFENDVEIDFASTRKEIYDEYGKLPRITETGCSLQEDVKRRDFTVNALIISLNKDNLFRLIDYSNGLEDLKNKKLRVLHEKSFLDDPSRMIRGLKFALRLGFELEEKTLFLQNSYLKNPLKNIPCERIKNELFDLFSLQNKDVTKYFTEQDLYKIFVNKTEMLTPIKKLPKDLPLNKDDIILLKFLSIFSKENPPEKLNLTTRDKKIIKELHNFTGSTPVFSDNYSLYKYFCNSDILSLAYYYLVKDSSAIEKFLELNKIEIKTTGNDLKELGLTEGKQFKEILEKLKKEKINNQDTLLSKEEEIAFIKQIIKL